MTIEADNSSKEHPPKHSYRTPGDPEGVMVWSGGVKRKGEEGRGEGEVPKSPKEAA